MMNGTKGGSEVVRALNSFTIEEKPVEALFRKRTEFSELLTALKNLSNDKSIKLGEDYLKGRSLIQFKGSLKYASKKIGLTVGAIQKGRDIYVFTR